MACRLAFVSVTILLASLTALGLSGTGISVSGIVLNVEPSQHRIFISCKSVGAMAEKRVISVSVADAAAFSRLRVGSMVDFTLSEDGGTYYGDSVRPHKFESVEQDPFTAHQLHNLQNTVTGTAREPATEVGEAVPDFRLVDQSNRPVSLSQFSGKVIAINFAYTRCALPQFCYRLTNNLAKLQQRFSSEIGRELVLMTITFDPVHDKPGVLSDAAKMWKANPEGWRFLTGSPEEIKRVCSRFGVDAWADEGLMIHSLHTVVIDSKQRLVANLEGNDFTSEQLGDLVEAVIHRGSPGK
jgi:protein SCO1